MELDSTIKEFIITNKENIEMMQWAMMSSISSLIYSEYIYCIKNKYVPVHKVHIPSIRTVQQILSIDGKLMSILKERFVDILVCNPLIVSYNNSPELNIFNSENFNMIKTVFNEYMLPNIAKRVPETISKKFDIGNPRQTIMIEDSHIEMFTEFNLFGINTINFLVEEFVLQFLTTIPSMRKDLEFPESNSRIYIASDEIISIGNEHAVCPILFNSEIINNKDIFNLLSFVTSTSITENEDHSIWKDKNEIYTPVIYVMDTNMFNEVCLTTLLDEPNSDEIDI